MPAPQPFRFGEGVGKANIGPAVSFGDRHDLSLAELLPATDTIAFPAVKDNAIVFEKYAGGYAPAALSLSFTMAKSFLFILKQWKDLFVSLSDNIR